jgi:predicted dehydrogenase
LPDAQVVGAYDVNPQAAKELSEKHGITAFDSIEEMFQKASPDVFVILTPSGDHCKTILKLAPLGRDFVVEKPLGLTLEDIDAALKECDSRGLKIFVVKQNRFNPPLRKLKEALEAGRFGRLVLGAVRVRWKRDQAYYDQKPWRGTWAYDGGVITNQASHHIDALLWMMGEVQSVVAMTATRLVNIEVEDTAVAILKFRNGALGVIEATTATRPKDLEGSLSVLGEKGSVEVGGFFMNELKVWNFAEYHPMDSQVWDRYAKVPQEPAWNHTEFYRDVLQCIRQGKKALIDGLEGRKSIELINAIYESAETGREVPLRFMPRKCRLGRAE